MQRIAPHAGLVIREDSVLAPGVHELGGLDGLVIDADDITVDGGGALLRAAARPPRLPAQGDYLYTPGDLGLSREEHVLALRGVDVAAGPLTFEYRHWGEGADKASVAVSADRKSWTSIARSRESREAEWHTARHDLGPRQGGQLHLRFTVPAQIVTPGHPLFYDGFRLLQGDGEIWRGDARQNWARWYNTGFSIWKRASRKYYGGIAIRSAGRKGVRLVNLRVEGFLTALHLRDCTGWTIEGNDFSDNYDDPDYGWGEGTESYGAMYLEGVSETTIRSNRGMRVWNGVSMRRCCGNTIEHNDFSHCSNTCLKMAQSSANLVADNVLSWGIRIYPEEVHARDSVSLLVESGSDRNRFLRNDFSHGGDGIFIRVLNHWCSTGNLFEENDCSYANNNAVEAWSPGNTYVRNKANWSSYGFWLGGSDDTVLLDNEVMHNGKANRNAPEPFGNAGVSVVHGSSSSFVMAGNRIEENSGPGVSVAYREEAPARHWLIACNTIRNNRNDPRGYTGHGVLLEYCDGIDLLGNAIDDNEGVQLLLGRSCRNVRVNGATVRLVQGLGIDAPAAVVEGAAARLAMTAPGGEASAFTELVWDLGEGRRVTTREAALSSTFARAGLARVCVTARGAGVAGAASRNLCVLPPGKPLASCTDAAAWRLAAPAGSALAVEREPSILGRGALVATVRSGLLSSLAVDLGATSDLGRGTGVAFFYRYACELFTHTGKRNRTVGVRLHTRDGAPYESFPELSWARARSEERYDWVLFSARWSEFHGAGALDPSAVRSVEILFGPDEPADCVFRLEALTLLDA